MSGAWVALQVFSSAEMFPFLLSKYFHSHNEKVKLFQISQSFMPIKTAIKLLPGYTLTIVSICIHSNCCSIQLSREFEPQKSRGIYKKRNTKNTRNRNENKSIDSARWKFSTVGLRFVLLCCRIKKSPKLLLRGATPSDVSMLTPSLLDAHSTTQTAQSQTKPPTPRQPPTKRASNPVLSSLPTLHPPSSYFASFSFQARTVRCKHSAVAAPNFTNNSRLAEGKVVEGEAGHGLQETEVNTYLSRLPAWDR